MNRGFTLVELLVSLAIFAIMTALLVAKYGNFNQSVLLTDTAYDIALVIHQAQTYGLSVAGGTLNENFDYPYGVHFSTNSNTNVTLFVDSNQNGVYSDSTSDNVTTYALKRGAIISGVCTTNSGTSCTPNTGSLDISYVRPNPDAKICMGTPCTTGTNTFAEVQIRGTDGSFRTISIYQNGAIFIN